MYCEANEYQQTVMRVDCVPSVLKNLHWNRLSVESETKNTRQVWKKTCQISVSLLYVPTGFYSMTSNLFPQDKISLAWPLVTLKPFHRDQETIDYFCQAVFCLGTGRFVICLDRTDTICLVRFINKSLVVDTWIPTFDSMSSTCNENSCWASVLFVGVAHAAVLRLPK